MVIVAIRLYKIYVEDCIFMYFQFFFEKYYYICECKDTFAKRYNMRNTTYITLLSNYLPVNRGGVFAL